MECELDNLNSMECFRDECSLCRERVVACCFKSRTAADRLFTFVELTSLVFNLHRSDIACFQFARSDIACSCVVYTIFKAKYSRTTLFFLDLSTQWKYGAVSSQLHGEVSQEYQNLDISGFPIAPFNC